MTLAQRLRAAATAEKLSDHVRVGCRSVWLLDDEGVFAGGLPDLELLPSILSEGWHFSYADDPNDDWNAEPHESKEAAVRAGLLALAEREEAKCSAQ